MVDGDDAYESVDAGQAQQCTMTSMGQFDVESTV